MRTKRIKQTQVSTNISRYFYSRKSYEVFVLNFSETKTNEADERKDGRTEKKLTVALLIILNCIAYPYPYPMLEISFQKSVGSTKSAKDIMLSIRDYQTLFY